MGNASAFGYFPLYEYGTISRNYGLGFLAVVGFCALGSRRPRRYSIMALLLVLMAWTSVYALLLSLALASAIVIDEVLLSHRLHRPGPGVRQVLATSAIVVVGVGAAALQLRAPADAVPVVDVEVANIGNAKTTAFLPWEALVPVPRSMATFGTTTWWNRVRPPSSSDRAL